MGGRSRVADWSAGALAVLVLALGGLVVIKPAVDHWSDLYRGDPFRPGTTTQKVSREKDGGASRTTITTQRVSSSATERMLGRSGLIALRLCLVALAAFLAAAALHRAIIGGYSLRIGAARAPEPALASEERSEREPAGSDGSGEAPATAENGSTVIQESSGGQLASAIGKLVASRREALQLSQRELAKRAGISHTVISRIESGQHAPSARTVERLADALR